MARSFTAKHSAGHLTKVVLLLVSLVAVAAFAGWLIGRPGKPLNSTSKTPTNNNVSGTDVASLVSYTLPDAWSQSTCSASAGTVYVVPSGTSLDCSANPSAPIKIFVDANNTTDCGQLANVQNVRKHICASLYINGHKSLKASTEYLKSQSYASDTTVSDYYINTGRGVVAVEYTYTNSNDYQIGFDQLANSVKVK